MYSIFYIILRERLNLFSRDAPAFSVRLISLAALAVLLTPSVTGLVLIWAKVVDPVRRIELLSWILVILFLLWWIIAGLLDFPLSWQIEVGKLAKLPLSFRRLYFTRSLVGLIGAWWICFAPPLVWIAWHSSTGLGWLVASGFAIVLFVLVTNQFVGLTSLAAGRRRRPLLMVTSLVVVFGAMNWAVFHLLIRSLGGMPPPVLVGVSAVGLHAWRWVALTPPGVLAGAFIAAQDHNIEREFAALGLLLAFTGALGTAEYVALRHRYLGGGGSGRPLRAFTLVDLAAALGQVMGPRGASSLVLLALQYRGLFRMRSMQLLTLFFVSYFLFFPLSISDITFPWLVIMAALPFVLFVHVKGNLFGVDCRCIRSQLSLPLRFAQLLAVRQLAVDLVITALAVEAVCVAVFSGHARLNIQEGVALTLFLLFSLLLSRILGAFFSVRFPVPVDPNRMYSGSNNPGSFGLMIGQVFILLVFLGGFTLAHRAGLDFAFLLMLSAATMGLLIVYTRSIEIWLGREILARRDQFLASLVDLGT